MSYHWTGVLRLFVGLGRRFLSQHFLVHIFFWLALSLQFFTEFHNFLIDDLQLKYNTVIKQLYIHDYTGFCVKGKISSQQAAHKDISLMLYQKHFPWGWLFTSLFICTLSFKTFLRSCLMKFESTLIWKVNIVFLNKTNEMVQKGF